MSAIFGDKTGITTDQVRKPTTNANVTVFGDTFANRHPDLLATEEPMEIRVKGDGQQPIAVNVTMRTPGNDFELAVGFLFNEGLIAKRQDVRTVCYCADVDREDQRFNVVTVELKVPFDEDFRKRNFTSSSACGICGSASIAELACKIEPIAPAARVSKETVLSIPEKMKPKQKIFKSTGGLHAASLFSQSGKLQILREDIGRHNAVDKLIGNALLSGDLPLSNSILGLSGRIGFELVQKAAMARIPFIIAVSAPSSLAVKTAAELGITLIGFTRENSANIYSHPENVELIESP